MKWIILISLFIFFLEHCVTIMDIRSAEEILKAKDPKNWSDVQGFMNWNSAKIKCNNLGMRLPSREEFKAAYEAGLTKSWKEAGFFSGDWFWTSQDELEIYAYYYSAIFNYDSTVIKLVGSHVRCIR